MTERERTTPSSAVPRRNRKTLGVSLAPSADAIVRRALRTDASPEKLVQDFGAEIAQRQPLAVVSALRHPRLHDVSLERAARAHVVILEAFECIRSATVWRVQGPGLRVLAGHPTRTSRSAARAAIAGHDDGIRARVRGMVIARGSVPFGAVVIDVRGDRELATAAAFESARALAPVLQAAIRHERDEAAEQAIVETAERRLSRIGFDLHDGPLQDLALLRGSVRLLRRHLSDNISDELAPILVGQVDDIDARVGLLNEELRTFARSFESPTFLRRPFGEVVEGEVVSGLADTGIRATITVTGDLERLTPSQRIAVFRIAQEATSNVRQHSQARFVRVSIGGRRGSVRLMVSDDGEGFDVARAVDSARRRGRVGLLAMGERARLLGGTFRVDSTPGGPTTVTVELPRWASGGADVQS